MISVLKVDMCCNTGTIFIDPKKKVLACNIAVRFLNLNCMNNRRTSIFIINVIKFKKKKFLKKKSEC